MVHLKGIKKKDTTGAFTQTGLHEIDLSFRNQEFVAILGPAGSGKTTLLNMIGGLDSYDSGELIIDGKSTKQFTDCEWAAYRHHSIGFIFQRDQLIPHLNLLDNVKMGVTFSDLTATEKKKKALGTLEKVGLKGHAKKKPTQLSSEQMQRAAIARALVNEPDIILAHEPTDVFDATVNDQLMTLIKELAEDKLVMITTAHPELATRYADRIVVFKEGSMISDSNPYTGNGVDNDEDFKPTAMSHLTALKLSGKKLATKKWRTALTAFVSSIGMIGVALMMSLSNGIQSYLAHFQSEAHAGIPLVRMQDASLLDEDMKKRVQETLIVFPNGFEPPENLMAHLDDFNDNMVEANSHRIVYLDQATLMMTTASGLLSAITFVLMVFITTSFVVSLMLIAMTMHLSVMERTEEIGILNVLGARRRDMMRVFHAETMLMGMCSGILAIIMSYLLTFPANRLFYQQTTLRNMIVFHPLHALFLLLFSLTSTRLGGLIPIRLAAKRGKW
ncbi:MAG: ABC transporter ATP-binding protein/permease [Defluviitaleaceae bacterium]|nr:ABC transporter ATP-binding protein/permease [Defluviitaleaceae bacterium]